jgi:hypothetical protein
MVAYLGTAQKAPERMSDHLQALRQLQDYLPAEAKKDQCAEPRISTGTTVAQIIERFRLPLGWCISC